MGLVELVIVLVECVRGTNDVSSTKCTSWTKVGVLVGYSIRDN